MAGIYIHIPFCKKACHYCDFHFSTSLKYKQEMLECLSKELHLRKDYLQGESVETIYFGGGTPSILSASELGSLIDQIDGLFPLESALEITIEANPDDLGRQHVNALRQTPVNRFSIGVQSFFDEDLAWMNRAHTAMESRDSIRRVQDAGFENITADLIYGYPLLSDEKWTENIKTMLELQVPHLSCYSMTVEAGTALASQIKKGLQKKPDDARSAAQFEYLMENLDRHGFEHYEISNFSLPGRRSRHNSSYWQGKAYLGIGPSAHSYNGYSRQWNVANNNRYMNGIINNEPVMEIETLSKENQANEYIMTSLRTIEGLNLSVLGSRFGSDYRSAVEAAIKELQDSSWTELSNECLRLSRQGKLYADHIASELFIDSSTSDL